MIRQARRADLADIWRIRLAVRENRLAGTAISDADVIDALECSGRGWVVESDGIVAGFAIGNATNGNIWALFVDPACEGLGYGRELFDVMVKWLWSRNLERLWLTTDAGTRASRFYEAAGWQRVDDCTDKDQLRYELRRPLVGYGSGHGEL